MDTNKMRDLKALAEAAPSGPWLAENDSLYFKDDGYTRHMIDADSGMDVEEDKYCAALAFIAAANPATLLTLLAEIEGLHAQHARDSGELRKLCSARDSARRQRDQLKAENEALRKDAERYRWLREYTVETLPLSGALQALDCRIDAARAKEASRG